MSITENTRRLAGTRWRLDPSASTAEFRVPMLWGLSSVAGRFQRFDGRLAIDDEDRWSLELTVDAASIDTGNPRRDRHLRSAAFFDVEQHPEVRFRSHGVDRGTGRVHGELEAAGRRVALEVELTVTDADGTIELDAVATVDQRSLGMTYSPLRVIGTPAALRVHARVRPQP